MDGKNSNTADILSGTDIKRDHNHTVKEAQIIDGTRQIRSHKDLIVWQKAILLVEDVYRDNRGISERQRGSA